MQMAEQPVENEPGIGRAFRCRLTAPLPSPAFVRVVRQHHAESIKVTP